MTSYAFINNFKINSQAELRLSLFLSNVESGSSSVLRSATAGNLDPEQILNGWDKIFNSKTKLLSNTLLALESKNRLSFGPRSVAIPWSERFSGVSDYFSPQNISSFPDAGMISSPRRLRPLTVKAASTFLKSNTNSGLPFITRKGEIKDLVVDNFDFYLGREDPCVLFTRTQESMKTRNVWGYPVVDTLNEMRFYRPLLEYQRNLSWRSALLSPQAVDRSITNLILNNSDTLVSIDFSKYDASVKTGLQRSCFKYISNLFQKDYEDELAFIQFRFNNIGLITPNGLLSGPHGVPSGSTFTNEVDSIAQYLCARDYGIQDSKMHIQGDDGAYSVKDVQKFYDHFENFGLEINDLKCHVSKHEVIYLQNLHSTDYVKNGILAGIYPTYRALGRIIFPERYDQYNDFGISGADFNSIRAISILENCSHHPLFVDLVKYLLKIDKFALQFTQQGLVNYIKRIKAKDGAEEILNYRLGKSITGIKLFNTYKLISELRP